MSDYADQDIDLEQEEGAGYLVSVSDLMSGLVFIFIITLVAFIINFQEAAQKTQHVQGKMKSEITRLNTIKSRMENNDYVRAQLLAELQKKLEKEYNIAVNIDEKHGVLRLTENSINFDTGSASLNHENLNKLHAIRSVLESVLPCFAANMATGKANCATHENTNNAYLEAIFIEGHTDNTQYRGDSTGQQNWLLSVSRAIKTYMELVQASDVLSQMKNNTHEAVFSVSGYGAERPLDGHKHETPTDDQANRRIDLRFIMTPPEFTEAEKAILKKEGGM